LNVRFDQVPHTLANDVTNTILLDDLDSWRASSFEFERPQDVPPHLLELGPSPAPGVQRRDRAAVSVDEEWRELT
jgi:hypothetical protein